MNTVKQMLTSVTGLFLALVFLCIPMKENAFLLSVKAPVTSTSTEIVLIYENKTGRRVSFCEDNYFAERKTENGWVAEPRLNRADIREVTTVMQPLHKLSYTIQLSEPLDAGEYRISQTFDVENYTLKPPFERTGTTHTATVEFTVS